MGHSLEVCLLGSLNQVPQVLMQASLILLHRQYMVGSLIQDVLGNLLLTAHGVNGDDSPSLPNFSYPAQSVIKTRLPWRGELTEFQPLNILLPS